jgi:4-amino-4-deoxychorismate lyase
VRLVLGAGGAVGLTTHPFAPLDGDMVWMLAIASTRLSSADPLLRHKTTRREAYARARAEFPATTVEEVLLLNERGEVCEGTITTLFVDRGAGAPLATPPLSSGLLAGVLRQSLLDTGQAVESVLEPRDLREAHALFVGNSLRGLIPARLDAAI